MLTEQFRRLASALTRHLPKPKPAQGKGTGGTRGAFKAAEAEFAGRGFSIPKAAFAAVAFLSDTLDWLNPWHHDTISCGAINEDSCSAEQNRLFPRMEP